MDLIEGRTTNAKPGQQVVLYAHSGIWWVQPFANHPFTQVQPDSSWKNWTHLGTDYAAILVDPGYKATAKLTNLPSEGNGVIAVSTTAGRSVQPVVSKTIHFSGYDWKVRTAASDRGGRPNFYDPANAWTDEHGFLHLRMEEHEGTWTCAEVNLTRSLGYGTYIFVVKDVSQFGPTAALALYTVDDYRTDNIRSELDIELSRWGITDSKNAQYVVQPFYVPENISRFMVPAGEMTHTLHWEPGRASFRSVRGAASGRVQSPVSEHVFMSGIPTPANESVHIGLYTYKRSTDSPQQPVEVVIEKFQFLP